MKSLIMLLFSTAIAPCYGQGTIVFANAGLNLDAPIFDAAGTRISGPSSFVADFFWSSDTSASMDQLIAAGFNQVFLPVNGNGGGYFNGGLKTLPTPGNVPILGQVRVWDTDLGATYTQARDSGGQFGFSNMFLVTPDLPPGGGTYLLGLKSFQITTIPEPSIIAAGVLISVLFMIKRANARVTG